jgi:hypothetical protein
LAFTPAVLLRYLSLIFDSENIYSHFAEACESSAAGLKFASVCGRVYGIFGRSRHRLLPILPLLLDTLISLFYLDCPTFYRALRYITRMLQKSPADCIFLLQFIVELLSDDQMEVMRVKEDKKRKKVVYPIEEGRRASDGDATDAVSLSRLRANTTLPSINRLFNSLGQTQGPAFSADPFDALANAAALARASQPGFPGYTPGPDGSSFNGEEHPKPPARPFKRVFTHTKSRSIEQEPAARWRSYSQSAGPSSPCDPDSMETDGAPDAKRRSIDPAFALAGLSDAAMSTSSSRTQSPVPSEPRTPPSMPQMAPMFPMHPQFPFMANPFPFGMPSYGFPGSGQVSDPSAMQVDPVTAASMFPVHPMFSPFGGVMFSANPMMMFPQANGMPKSS